MSCASFVPLRVEVIRENFCRMCAADFSPGALCAPGKIVGAITGAIVGRAPQG
jgi:hypothetical protein